MTEPLPDPLADLDRLLSDPDLPDHVMLLTQVDALIAASLVAPGPLAEADWLPLIWDGGESPFDAATRDRLRALVMAHKATIVGELLRSDGEYGPIYDIDPRDEVPLWEVWIEAFAKGVALADAAWDALAEHEDEDLATAAVGLSMLIVVVGQPNADAEFAEQAPDLIPYLVETLYRRQRNLPRVVLDPVVTGLPGLR